MCSVANLKIPPGKKYYIVQTCKTVLTEIPTEQIKVELSVGKNLYYFLN